MFPVKDEFPGGSSSSSISWQQSSDRAEAAPPPRPLEGLHEAGPPPFVTKTFDMVDDPTTTHIVSWSRGGRSFVVWDPNAFSSSILPTYFKHSNFSSFVRQLNTYRFKKIHADKWEFANEAFVGGRKHLLKNIRRRKADSQAVDTQHAIGPFVELRRFGQVAEIDRLRRDKQVLTTELLKLRRRQQNARADFQEMKVRLHGMERKQQEMIRFLTRAILNPDVIHRLFQQKKRKELEEAVNKKRRLSIEVGESSGVNERVNPVKAEALEFGDPYGFQVSEPEALALEMQGFGRAKRGLVEESEEELGSCDKQLHEGFWEELLNEGFDGKEGKPTNGGEGKEDDVNVLANTLGFLGSSPN